MVTNMEKGLLDTLQEIVECTYLSDLHIEENRDRVRMAIMQVRSEDYSAHEWQDAAHYLRSNRDGLIAASFPLDK